MSLAQRALRPLRRALRPVVRRFRPTAAAARAGKPGKPPRENAWRFHHEEPPERRISVLEGRHPGTRMLVVATGPSAQQVVPWDARLHDRYDIVIALNGSVSRITSLDYFLSVESQAHLWDWYHHPLPERVQRCVSESGLRLARESGRPDAQAERSLLHLRHRYRAPVEIRHYRNAKGEEGLLVGPKGLTGLGAGTVSLQAIHFASLLGASEIHLVGADLHFRGPVQHFYGDNEYGTHEVDGKRYHALDVEARLNPIELTTHPRTGETVETTLHFRESADYIDEVARTILPPAGIRLVDFSDGLLSVPSRGDFAVYMETGQVVEPVADPVEATIAASAPAGPRAVTRPADPSAAPRPLLRPATPEDRDLVLAWANDPLTRAAGFHPDPIGDDAHDRWFAARLADPDGRLWIAEVGAEPVGQVRAHRRPDGRVELGISVAPDRRGRGLAGPLLASGIQAAARDLAPAMLVAEIRPENAASLRVFRGAGFRDAGTVDHGGLRGVVLERRPGD